MLTIIIYAILIVWALPILIGLIIGSICGVSLLIYDGTKMILDIIATNIFKTNMFSDLEDTI